MKKKIKKQQYYKDIPIDSEGELHFIYWMEELKHRGFIKTFERGESKLLSDSLTNNYAIQLKTRSKPAKQNILMGHTYNWDFTIDWTDLGIKFFVNRFGEKWDKPFIINSKSMSYIESKPPFNFQNMTRLAILNIKWMWEKYQIFIQMVKNIELFEKTFTPKAYLTTPTGKKRITKYKVRSLDEYLKTIK